jgi:hypothetical protein
VTTSLKDGKLLALESKAHSSAILMEMFGTTDTDFVGTLLNQLADNGGDEKTVNFMLSVIHGIKPRDQIEAMLAAQMAVVHMTAMKFPPRFAHVETIAQNDSIERAFNKLVRTFTMLTEALKRHRTGGEQKVTVQHVTVGEGGKAIVGNVTQAAPEPTSDRPGGSAPLLGHATTAPMPDLRLSRQRAPVQARRRGRE